jgi:signal transduction histidine kinase
MDIDRLIAVSRLTDSLSRATTLDEVYTVALDALQNTLGITRAAVLLFDDHGVIQFVAARGLSDAYRAALTGYSQWGPETANPEPTCVSDVRDEVALRQYVPAFDAEGIRAVGFFALNYRDHVIGRFTLCYGERHDFYPDEIEVAKTIAGQIAFGVARIRAEQALERERDRAAFLAEASAVLASSLEYEKTMQQVAELIVPELCDWCVIDLIDDEGAVQRIAVVHRDPEKAEWVSRLKSQPPHELRNQYAGRVIDSGEPVLLRAIGDELRQRLERVPELAAIIRGLRMESLMIVPLSVAGRTFGAISLVSSTPDRCYDDHDLGTAIELSRRAAYAIDNARLYQHAQEANRAKDDFLATLSHELRTPMTATLGWATMLRMRDLSAENFQLAVETIERSTRAQAKLIDEILDVSRVITGKLQLTMVPVHLASVIEAAVETIRPSITAKAIDLQLDLVSVDGVAFGDASRLQQVIWNLLSNSVKFTPNGGSIAIRIDQPASGSARIIIRDSGAGIARKFLPYIFERFRQADSTATRRYGGLGLGLAIVKNIVELHGGNVIAESEGEGKGATFTVTLPLASASAQAVLSPTSAVAPSLTLYGVSVLLVEDEDDTRRMLAAALQNFGAAVTAVASAPAAIEALRANKLHVVVSDIGMPGEDGCMLMTRIRAGAVETMANIPAIALTAYARPEDRERIQASGFGFHLAKPVDPVAFVETVREAAGR